MIKWRTWRSKVLSNEQLAPNSKHSWILPKNDVKWWNKVLKVLRRYNCMIDQPLACMLCTKTTVAFVLSFLFLRQYVFVHHAILKNWQSCKSLCFLLFLVAMRRSACVFDVSCTWKSAFLFCDFKEADALRARNMQLYTIAQRHERSVADLNADLKSSQELVCKLQVSVSVIASVRSKISTALM